MISIRNLIFKRGITLGFKSPDQKIRKVFKRIKEERDEHLQAINENTNEINANYEYICELESKVEKLTARLDQLQSFIQERFGNMSNQKISKKIQPLNNLQQDIFTILYTLQEEKGSVTVKDVQNRLGIDEDTILSEINSMIEKNIPIKKRFIDGEPYLKLDDDFKTSQAKENIVNIAAN